MVVGLARRDDEIGGQLDLAEKVAVLQRHIELVGHYEHLSDRIGAGTGRKNSLPGGRVAKRGKYRASPGKPRGTPPVGEAPLVLSWGRASARSRTQSARTFSARGPLGPWVTSNSTFWFSSRDL